MIDFDDCFTPSTNRMFVGEALARFSSRLETMTGVESVAVGDGLGRILASPLISGRDIPPHDNSAVDGYAVYFDDLKGEGETILPVTGRIAAGHPLERPARKGEALQIFTGGQAPEGPDTVYMVEDIRLDGDTVILPAGIKRGANYRFKGEDVKTGDQVLNAGVRLRPQDIGMAASLGFAEIEVYKRLKVAVFSTGDEVRDVGAELDDGCIYDINRYAIIGMLEKLGCEISDLGIFPDDFDAIREALRTAAGDHDLMVTSGGVSKGEEDYVRNVIADLGAIHVWDLAIKPGRPIALGHVDTEGGQVPFIGLPGNPVAVMVTFLCIARHIVLKLSGAAERAPPLFKVPAGFDYNKKPGRREWLRASLDIDGEGRRIARKFVGEGSGILSSMVQSDGFVELAEDHEMVAKGDLVDFLPFSEVMG